jgi:acyl-CoA synthetase (AMP-forming)/AMP-acid ligase II
VIEIYHSTLPGMLRRRAAIDPEGRAYTFLGGSESSGDSVTWLQLDQRATALATRLTDGGVAGQPVLLALKSGLQFVEALFACWYAGAIAVPVSLPRHQRLQQRLNGIIMDSGVRFAIGTTATQGQVVGCAPAAHLNWIFSETATVLTAASPDVAINGAQPALLQYTSGSTGAPRGVVVTHANLSHNSGLIAEACSLRQGDVIAGWLPLFHDMGLIGLVLQAVAAGVHCVLMSPERFLMRPWLWLQMISDHRACGTAAPNFAYDLCAERVDPERKAKLDLSCWRTALTGSEPVRAATLERFAAAFECCGFRRSAFFPCYGLAEATLLVSAPGATRNIVRRQADGSLIAEGSGAGGYVGCGKPVQGLELKIVDPQLRTTVTKGEIGEIWVSGASVAAGYWNNTHETTATFAAVLEGSLPDGALRASWLRTGDLGFQDGSGELFITGRLREMMIVAGRNHFPVDIEHTVETAHESVAESAVVAFSMDIQGLERLIIAAEIRRPLFVMESGRPRLDTEAICQHIRLAVTLENDVAPFEVVLLRPGAIPRTSSGKIQRLATREAYCNGTLETLEGCPVTVRRA